MKKTQTVNKVSICHKDNCIHATGHYGDIITVAAAGMLLLFGIAALAKS